MARADAWDAFGRDDGASVATRDARRERRERAAATHAFFDDARRLWRDARDGATLDARATATEIARAHDALWTRAAEELGEHAPCGTRARDALASAAASASAEAWDACARWARRTIAACAEQLGRGNWPVSGFLEAHTLAHGWLVVAAMASDGGGRRRGRARGRSRGERGVSGGGVEREGASREDWIGLAHRDDAV